MNEDAVLLALGNLQGQMEGMNEKIDIQVTNIGREIKGVRDILKCKSDDCTECRKQIDGEINTLKGNVQSITLTHVGEERVRSWKDKTLGELVIIIGAASGLVVLVGFGAKWILTGQLF